jgi:hypothetical protein
MILFACPSCPAIYPVSEDLAGKSIRCRKCDRRCTVPEPDPDPAPPPRPVGQSGWRSLTRWPNVLLVVPLAAPLAVIAIGVAVVLLVILGPPVLLAAAVGASDERKAGPALGVGLVVWAAVLLTLYNGGPSGQNSPPRKLTPMEAYEKDQEERRRVIEAFERAEKEREGKRIIDRRGW